MPQVLAGYQTQRASRRREQLFELVDQLTVLPCTSVVPMRLLELQREGTTGMAEIAEVLAADPGLSTRIIALINAEAFGRTAPVTKLSQAFSMIGLENLLPLAFGLSLAGMFNPFSLPTDERTLRWRSSLLKAMIAREYADRHCPQFSEEAFLCGLIQDIAIPIIYASDRSAWPETQSILAMEDDAERSQRERSMYGTDHAELGERILARVGMPELYRKAVGAHHEGVDALRPIGDAALAKAVHVAGALPHRAAQFNQALANRVGRALGATAGRAEAVSLLATACDKQAALIGKLGESEELSVAYKESLQALCAQVAVSVQSAVHTSIAAITDLKARENTLQGRVSELSQRALQSDFDALTGVLNRRGFMARAPRVLAMACEYQGWCGIGFVDMDNFKSLNDGLGHAAGDQALTTVATRLRERLQGRGIVGRLGGDEFCFIMLATRMDNITAEADRVKAIFKDLRVESAGQSRDLTVSVGLLSLGSPPKLQDLGAAMKRADELMYGAKTSGKNRCVVGSV